MNRKLVAKIDVDLLKKSALASVADDGTIYLQIPVGNIGHRKGERHLYDIMNDGDVFETEGPTSEEAEKLLEAIFKEIKYEG